MTVHPSPGLTSSGTVPSSPSSSSAATSSAHPRPTAVSQWSVVDVQKWFRRNCGDYYHLYSEKLLEQDVTG